ncbi:FliM/FliN family flagellar motor C-terminal domain-containing protein [Rhodosalinus sp.]|uniref:FliM/FliN family flagellar motor C-terminal domain-containing protein n=1 Tax=Rhodosalinus sp. TaxID=2047741 RepID=UPI003978FBCA
MKLQHAEETMGGEQANPILRRKTTAGRRQQEARAPSAKRALRLALARTAETRLRLGLVVTSATEQSLDQEALIAALDESGMILLIEGPDGRAGAMVLDAGIVAGVVQHQTTGRVSDAPPEPRRFTATDAAIVAPLVEGMLERAADDLAQGPEADWVAGLRFGARLDGLRALALALRASDFRLFGFSVELAAGARRGEFAVALPAPPEPDTPEPDAAAPKGPAATATRAPVELVAILHRLRMPLTEAAALAPGTLLPLPGDVLSRAVIATRDGQTVTPVSLGRLDGMRALRLSGGAVAAGEAQARGTARQQPAAPDEERTAQEAVSASTRPARHTVDERPKQDFAERSAKAATEPLPELPPLEIDAPFGGAEE